MASSGYARTGVDLSDVVIEDQDTCSSGTQTRNLLPGVLDDAAEQVDALHFAKITGSRRPNSWITDDDGQTLGSRDGDVQSVSCFKRST